MSLNDLQFVLQGEKVLAEKCDDEVVLINSISVRCTIDYLTEGTLSVFLPKFWDGSTGLGFDDERSHDCRVNCLEVILFGTIPNWAATLSCTLKKWSMVGLATCLPRLWCTSRSTYV
jgi:hypothetical protein